MISMATLKDIARLLNVNASTVSRALNDSPSISEEMREKVRTAAEELGYSLHGRGGREAQDWSVAGLIIPEATSEYYAKIAHLAQERLAQRGLGCLVQLTRFDPSNLVSAIRSMARIRVKCLLIVMDSDEKLTDRVVDMIRDSGIPTMLVTSGYLPRLDVDCIHFDETVGLRAGLEHLVQRGYHRIGYLGETMTESRRLAFTEILHELGYSCPSRLIAMGKDRGEMGGYLRMKELLGLEDPPDAVFAAYDQMAIGALHAIREAGLSAPEDIAVLGFDDVSAAKYIEGGISTVAVPSEDMIAIALNILLKRMQDPNRARQQIALRPRLVVRKTT